VATHVFVSYSRGDGAYVDALAAFLTRQGIPVWIDRERISTGDQWVRTIREKVDTCAAMVVVMTPSSEESQWVGMEIERARLRGKAIFPLLLSGDPFFSLGTLHAEDVRGHRLPPDEFVAKLRTVSDTPTVPRPAQPAVPSQLSPPPSNPLWEAAAPPTVLPHADRGRNRGRRVWRLAGIVGIAVATVALVAAVPLLARPLISGGGGNNPESAGTSSSTSSGTPYVPPPGVTATEILIGTHQPLTGPAASSYSTISAATKAYFAYVNANGGVNGRTIRYVVEDDGYNPSNTTTVVHDLVENQKVFAIVNGLGAQTHSVVLDYLNDHRIPDLFIDSAAKTWNQPSKYPGTFGLSPSYYMEGKIIGYYIRNIGGLATKAICQFGEADDYGSDNLAGLQAGLGAQVSRSDVYSVGATSFVTQITALKSAGCQVIVTASLAAYTGLAIATAAALNYRPQWIAASQGGDYAIISNGAALRTNPQLLEGLVSSAYLPSPNDANDPWVKLFKNINDQYNSGHAFDSNALYGMTVGYLTVQALLKAGRNLTADGLLKALEQGLNRGPGLAPLTYSPTNHTGYSGVRMTRVTSGVQAAFGDVYTTDPGSGSIVAAAASAETPPPDGIPKA
jgi:ABC-type branched-subunit amino acid transport system substrate-binding protein